MVELILTGYKYDLQPITKCDWIQPSIFLPVNNTCMSQALTFSYCTYKSPMTSFKHTRWLCVLACSSIVDLLKLHYTCYLHLLVNCCYILPTALCCTTVKYKYCESKQLKDDLCLYFPALISVGYNQNCASPVFQSTDYTLLFVCSTSVVAPTWKHAYGGMNQLLKTKVIYRQMP